MDCKHMTRARTGDWLVRVVAVVGLVIAGDARAGQTLTSAPDPVTPIYGGHASATCGWPTTVSMEGSCTGTLVDPRVVVYASHCGADYAEVWLGESINSPARVVPTSFCRTHPQPSVGVGRDIAFCVLAESVDDVPIIPILMGCEVDALQPGRKTTLVGYGYTEVQLYGVKHEVTTIIEGFADNEILLGGDGNDACNGDSGGPGFLRLDPDTFPGGDGSWRVFGITSYGKSCGGSTYYSMIHTNIEWLEATSGIDVTPCHDTDGTWNPSARCGQVPLAPAQPVGTWNDGCGGGPQVDWLSSCGEPFAAPEDSEPPVTAVTAPGNGSVFEIEGETAKIYVRIDSEDPGGWGLKAHTLLINGQELPVLSSTNPLELGNVVFPHGTFELQSRATDYAGNSGLSEVVTIVVGPPGTGESEGPTTGGMTNGDTSSSTTADATSEGSTTGDDAGTESTAGVDDEGCGCKTGHGRHGYGLFGLAALVWFRRRTSEPR